MGKTKVCLGFFGCRSNQISAQLINFDSYKSQSGKNEKQNKKLKFLNGLNIAT